MLRFWAVVFFCATISKLTAQNLALTLDDAPAVAPTPLMAAALRNERLLAAFSRHHLRVAVFAYGVDGGDSAEGRRILTSWGQAGHLVGNHTYSHRNLHKIPLQDFIRDFQRCDAMISTIPGYAKWLRFPYLKEGDTMEKLVGMREALRKTGYRNASVSAVTFDWLIDQHLSSALKRNPSTPLGPYRTYYVQHVITSIRQAEQLAKTLALNDPPLVVLLHDNLLNALFIDDLIIALKSNGCTFISPDKAYQHPIYQSAASKTNAGETLLWVLASERGIPAEKLESRYAREESMLNGLGL